MQRQTAWAFRFLPCHYPIDSAGFSGYPLLRPVIGPSECGHCYTFAFLITKPKRKRMLKLMQRPWLFFFIVLVVAFLAALGASLSVKQTTAEDGTITRSPFWKKEA
jgi:hypothetical protein